MDVRLIPVKIKERLNKIDSSDYDNLKCWNYIEAFNKAQLQWCRRHLPSLVNSRETGESTVKAVENLQILINTQKLYGINKQSYFESVVLPKNYFFWTRVTPLVSKGSCNHVPLDLCFLREEANVPEYLTNALYEPSFEWRETFCTLADNKVRVYTKGKFSVESIELTYYRFPIPINLAGCEDLSGVKGKNVNPEFKDDIVELIIDEAASILASDIESYNQMQTSYNRTEINN